VKKHLAVILIVLGVVACYAPAIRNGFVWDDTALILRDPLIRSWRLIPEGFNHYLFVDATASDFYRPLQRLTYTVEYAFFTVRPAPYHCTNVLLHSAAAVALFFFAEALLGAFGLAAARSRSIAFLGTIAWAIHPIQSAAVDYVSGRADLLAALFGFGGCYCALRALRESGGRKIILPFVAGLAFLASALSKETGLMFPLLAIVFLLLLQKRVAAIRIFAITIFVAAIYLSLRMAAEHNPAPSLGTPAPLSARPITIARAVAEYTGLILLPVNLHMDRTVQNPGASDANISIAAWRELQTLAGCCLITLLMWCAIRARKRDRVLFALLALAALSYLPVSGVLLLNASVAEHWIYVPSAFLLLAGSAAAFKAIETSRLPRVVLQMSRIVFACWIGFLGSRTFLRTFDWKDQRTFLERTIASGGGSARMLINLGGLELSENRLDFAKKDLQSALRKEPDQPLAIINLAAVALKQNDFQTARDLLGRATHMPFVEAEAHELLAVLENKEKGRADLLRLRLAARTGVSNWSIEKRYIRVLAETGATVAAIQELKNCLRSEWYRAESWQLLSQLLQKSGHPREAAEAMACANTYDSHLAVRPLPL